MSGPAFSSGNASNENHQKALSEISADEALTATMNKTVIYVKGVAF
jgi:hypothetical protein